MVVLEMAQQLRTLTALAEDQGSIPSTHTFYEPVTPVPDDLTEPLLASEGTRHTWSVDTQAG